MSQKQAPRKKKRRLRLKLPFLQQNAAKRTAGTTAQPRRRIKRRLRLKKEVLLVLLGVVVILAAALIPRTIETNKLKNLGYTSEEIKEIRNQKLAKTLIDKQWYSPYLASAITEGTLNTDYMVYYTAATEEDPLDAQDFLLIGRLKDKGYTEDQIVELFKELKFWEMTPLLVFDYQYNEALYIDDCLNNRASNSPDFFELAQNYYTHYENTHAVDNPGSTDMLVNKTYYLDASYKPSLVDLDTYYSAADNQLTREAADALDAWGEAGRAVGVTFYATSAYRGYESQDELYKIYKQAQGEEEADRVSARPGFSEHQTGLTVDIAATNEDDKDDFKDTKAYLWNKSNCQDYGWILRYPEGKEQITGYEFESWHYRYLGKELATAVKDSHLTFDEFWMLYLRPWDSEEFKPAEDILKAADYRKTAAPAETDAEPSPSPES
ncbi:MAG: M15 family metallopeptidase [Solobacterium sp.]|nr:M15 family metallopeptidase [Solobacterium sp.]